MRPTALVVAFSLALAGSPAAALVHFDVTVPGVLVSGSGPEFQVGDPVVFRAHFTDLQTTDWGNQGFSAAGLQGLSSAGAAFSLTINGQATHGTDFYDGFTHFTYDLDVSLPSGGLSDHREWGDPIVLFTDQHVIGLEGELWPQDTSTRPPVYLGTGGVFGHIFVFNDFPGGPVTTDASFSTPHLSDTFLVEAGGDIYRNTYPGRFTGVWDFAHSTVTSGIPEPMTWALLISGLGLAGAALRRRRSVEGVKVVASSDAFARRA
jgi:hypothetical protein